MRVRIVATGVCHTDAFTLSGDDPEGIFPAVLGHEGGGIVESIGEGVTSVAVAKASRIVVIDINESKFDLARKLGATDFINPKNYDKTIQNVIVELTDGGNLHERILNEDDER